MLTIKYQAKFKKDYKKIKKRCYDIQRLEKVISLLAEEKKLPDEYLDHGLTGDYKERIRCALISESIRIRVGVVAIKSSAKLFCGRIGAPYAPFVES